MSILVALTPVYIVLSFTIADIADRKNRFNFWWAFFFGLTLTPVASLLLVLTGAYRDKRAPLSHFRQTCFIVLSFACFIAALLLWTSAFAAFGEGCIFLSLVATGLAGAGVYSMRRVLYGEEEDV